MKVSVAANITINDDSNPTDIRFSSGSKVFSDNTTWNECEASTFALAASAADLDLPLGSLSDISMLYLFTKTAGVKVKVFTGAMGETPSEMELIPNCPCIMPVKAKSVSVSNTGGSATSLVYAAAGN